MTCRSAQRIKILTKNEVLIIKIIKETLPDWPDCQIKKPLSCSEINMTQETIPFKYEKKEFDLMLNILAY